MSRALGYCLTAGRFNSWFGFVIIAKARLTVVERAALAWAALRSLDSPDQAEIVAEGVISRADAPMPFLNTLEDARWWASLASLSERKAYALAAYEALPFEEQMAFRRSISEVEVAI
ncbi:hypothetical protein [uncultured Ruegeria sp.]|uniref:hypothetical protein n=1 Tax=uncultured Ruegeria sp. TaxID=259304 RepID=UPI002626FFD4|nr:hypothetical protein [uncultured Ruegeria sp.]